MEDKFETLGQLIDRLDNLGHGLQIPMSPSIHVDQLKVLLPEITKELKDSFIELSGTNPWE